MTWDVIVVGAGPAGATTAALLAEQGVRVALLDKARFPRVKPCAEYVNPEAVRILDRLGVRDQVLDAGAAVFRGMRVASPGGRTVAIDYQADAGRPAIGLSRERLDALLVVRCRDLGVEVLEGTRARDVIVEENVVRGIHASESGRPVALSASIVVGADGHHSSVARSLRLDLPVRWPRRIGLAAHFDDFPLSDGLGEIHVGRAGYCGIAPQEEGRVNVAMVVDLDRFEARSGPPDAFFDATLRRYPPLAGRLEHARRVSPVRGVGPLARRVRRVSGAGFLLVGDAAGFFDPITGEGIYDALRGGELAAATVAAALGRGAATAAALRDYDTQRHREFAAKRRAAWLAQLFVVSPRLMDYAFARLARDPRAVATMTGVFGNYRDAGELLRPGFLWRALRPWRPGGHDAECQRD